METIQTKEPFTEKQINKAKEIILGRIELTSPNTVYFVTSAKLSGDEVKKLYEIGFEVIEISPIDNYAMGILLIWKKELPAEVREGTVI